ncbi:hypothetical protein Plec18167_000608 [Paecilomyces lecythidis]|uniref:Apple domain-containing protein n=1 Tax=Paecilomyces lecythidis TaxID=3004212 RepID=A0ABR3YEE5_9EURO
MTPIRSFILMASLAAANVEALSGCQTSVHNETIAYFNSAPVTFSFELATATDCQTWCGKVRACQAWVYVRQSRQCDLHRTMALSTSDNTGFTFGGCSPNPANETQLAPLPSAVSHSTASSIPVTMETTTLVRFLLPYNQQPLSSPPRSVHLGLTINE